MRCVCVCIYVCVHACMHACMLVIQYALSTWSVVMLGIPLLLDNGLARCKLQHSFLTDGLLHALLPS